jgi:DNA-binding beta-propeller fold protein YncE
MRRLAGFGWLVVLLVAACGAKLDLPVEPDATGNPQGEVAYVRKYPAWTGIGRVVDLMLTSGTVLYGVVEDSGRVRSWLSDAAVPRINPGRSIPENPILDGDTLRAPERICDGRLSTLWVAYRLPHPRLVQWNIAASPPTLVLSGVVRDDSILAFGGIAADRDSGFVYAVDSQRSTVTKYAPSSSGGSKVALLAGPGNGDHFLQHPQGIFYFSDSLLVADTGKGWIQVLDADRPFSGRGQVTGPAADPLTLRDPNDVWMDDAGFYYVADTGNGRVLKLTRQGTVKEIVTAFDPDPVGTPTTIVADDDRTWVADPSTGRLTLFQINTVTEDLP